MTHVRVHHSVLADTEKRLLIRIARRLPPWVTSDQLTALALAAMVAAGAAFVQLGSSSWACALFVLSLAVNWFGDSLDGTLARVRNQQRPRYGYYVDHVVDLAGTAALLGGMAASSLMTPAIAMALLAAYCLVSAESYLATATTGMFRISFAGIGPTELRIILAAGAIASARHPWVDIPGGRALLLDVGGLIAVGGLASVFATAAIRNGRALYVMEPLPDRMTACESSTAPRSPLSATSPMWTGRSTPTGTSTKAL